VLGKLKFDDRSLRELLLDAIRYGDQPKVRARLMQVVAESLDREHLRRLLAERALSANSLGRSRFIKIREDMERAETRRLQPHFVSAFFREAFHQLGGTIREREPHATRSRTSRPVIRNRDRAIGRGAPVMTKYERVTFEKDLIALAARHLPTCSVLASAARFDDRSNH